MQMLIDKENTSKDKIIKPDFSTKTGREFLAFYLHFKPNNSILFVFYIGLDRTTRPNAWSSDVCYAA